MHWKYQYEIKYFMLQVGRKAQLAMELDRWPPASYRHTLESQLPSYERKKEKYVQEQV